jgi:hypothetical protein
VLLGPSNDLELSGRRRLAPHAAALWPQDYHATTPVRWSERLYDTFPLAPRPPTKVSESIPATILMPEPFHPHPPRPGGPAHDRGPNLSTYYLRNSAPLTHAPPPSLSSPPNCDRGLQLPNHSGLPPRGRFHANAPAHLNATRLACRSGAPCHASRALNQRLNAGHFTRTTTAFISRGLSKPPTVAYTPTLIPCPTLPLPLAKTQPENHSQSQHTASMRRPRFSVRITTSMGFGVGGREHAGSIAGC